jgi:hypothetical protein
MAFSVSRSKSDGYFFPLKTLEGTRSCGPANDSQSQDQAAVTKVDANVLSSVRGNAVWRTAVWLEMEGGSCQPFAIDCDVCLKTK